MDLETSIFKSDLLGELFIIERLVGVLHDPRGALRLSHGVRL